MSACCLQVTILVRLLSRSFRVSQSDGAQLGKHGNILKRVVLPFGEEGMECLSPQHTTLVINSTHSWAGYAFLWRMVRWSIIMYYLVPLLAQCLIVHGRCSADVCGIEVTYLFNVFSITLWVLWSQGLCGTCLCVPSSTHYLAYNASLFCSHRIPIHLSKIVQIPPSLRWALF